MSVFARGVCAVVVTYHPTEAVLANIAAVRAQVARLIVVDNSATEAARLLLAPLAGDAAVTLLFNEKNRGIATALNQGARLAREENYGWLATFDQDSRAPADLVRALAAAWLRWPARSRVAVVTPVYRDRGLGFVYSAASPLEATEPVRAVSVAAASGNLVSLAAWAQAGGFREDFFIDCVDFEFCLRCRRAGWQVLENSAAVLDHAQGQWEVRKFWRRRPRINDYGAVRRYYQARNRLLMYAGHWTFDPAWIARDARGYAWDLFKLALFCTERPAKFRAVFRGWWHACSGGQPRPPG